MNELKIIITGPKYIDKKEIINFILELNDDISVIPHCTNLQSIENTYDGYVYYLDTNSIRLAYKNNSLMTIITDNYISDAIAIDDFYNNDICYVTVAQFNMIADSFLKDNNILIIWLDTKSRSNITDNEIIEIKYLQENIDNYKYLYFLDEDNKNIANIINKYILSSEEERNELLSQYS